MKKILIAFQFLTIMPVRINMVINEKDIAESSSAFVVVGLTQGILLIATDYIARMVFHPDLSTGLILLVLVLSNGGFHLDGLADTFDAIAVKSEGNIDTDRKRRLSIMKDSTTGPVGVIAIVFSLAIKYLSLKNISHFSFLTYYSSLILMPAMSKWAMVVSMFHGKPSREDGLGRIFVERAGIKEVTISTMTIILSIMILPYLFKANPHGIRYALYAISPVVIYLSCLMWVVFFNRKFGGLNGDTLGAISEVTEVIFLLVVILCSQLFI
jgi:adenosylcobinamide-GDP ribazoletransferase